MLEVKIINKGILLWSLNINFVVFVVLGNLVFILKGILLLCVLVDI